MKKVIKRLLLKLEQDEKFITVYGSHQYYPDKGAANENILSDYQQSAIEFEYDRQSDSWKCNTNTNFNISNVTVSYPADFTLARGETNDFVIKYDYVGRGAAEVTYTLKWA